LVLQPPTLSVNRTVTLPNGTGTLALTSDISYPVTSVFGRTGAVVATSGDYTTAQVTEVTNLYFTDSRARLALSGSTGISYNNTTGVITNSAPDQTVALTASTGISVTGTYPNFTITNTSPSSGGTVTSVAALTLGTTGTDLSSSVATSTTTPVITLNVPTASATNRGALSSADFTTFNNKQGTITLTTTGTSGAATFTSNTLNIPNYTITNAVTGTGTTNYLPKFTGTSTIGNSLVYDNGTSVGIGTITPFSNAKLQIKTTTNVNLGFQTGTLDATGFKLNAYNDAGSANIPLELNASILYFKIAEANKMTLDASGNLGLGVTPSAWGTVSPVFQIGTASLYGYNNTLSLSSNAYYNAGDKYIQNGYSTQYYQTSGQHIWYNAPSGTAGAAITFTQAMTLNASGNLGLGTPSPDGSDWNASSRLLHIYQNTTNGALLKLESSNTSGILAIGNNQMQFGTVTDDTLILYTNSAERMRIWNTTGNVNIGTTPASDSGYKLDVNGTGRFSSSVNVSGTLSVGTTSSNYKFTLKEAGVAGAPLFAFVGNASNGNWMRGYWLKSDETTTIAQLTVQDGDAMYIGTITSIPFIVQTANTTRLTIASTGAATFSSSVTAKNGLISWSAGSAANLLMNDLSGNSKYELGWIASSNEFYIYSVGGSATILKLTTTGSATFTGSVTATSFFESSDSRLKTLIQDNYQTKGIASITPKLYTKNGKVELGYYAQDFVGILDSAVSKGSDDMLSLSYREVLVAKVYALEQRIKELENK
jgi:hypothetical protein